MPASDYEQYVPSKFRVWMQENPVINGAIALLAGVLIGAVLF